MVDPLFGWLMKTARTFKISGKLVWFSSICLGVLTAIPKIAEHHFVLPEAIADACVTSSFALLIWYYNIRTFPAYAAKDVVSSFSTGRLVKGLFFGLALMFVLASLQQYLLSHINFGPAVLMFEVRGILISLTFYMFIHLLYQGYMNQQVSLELERAKSVQLWTQYELLKQQVNPHFLFNSLNTLKYLVESGDAQAVRFLLKLSDFYRFTLESRKHNLVQLAGELETLDAYIYLLKARFEDGLVLSIEISNELKGTWIPPFTLQLLIENCIKHNIVSVDRPLKVHLYSTGGHIIVENNIQEKKTSEASTGLGLENISQRYLHLQEKPIEILVENGLFIVKLPIIHENSNH